MRIAWTGPIGGGGGVPAMGNLILGEMLRQGVEVDVYMPRYEFERAPLDPRPRASSDRTAFGLELGPVV